MPSKSEQIAYELLALGFRAYPRSVFNGFAFACLTVIYVWPGVPHRFLAAWLGAVILVALARLWIARVFLRSRPSAGELRKWTAYGAIGYGVTGLLWGGLGAACIYYAAPRIEYILVIAFLIAFFAVLQSQLAAAHSAVFRSFLYCAWAPIVAVSLTEPAPNYQLRLLFEALMIVVTFLVGRSGNRAVQDSLTMRYENVELLHDLTLQKDALDKANRAKTRFFAAASHDLRQPMQAIVLLVESLQERVSEPEARRIAKNIRSSVNAMAALLNALLDIAKFDAGTVKPERTHFNVGNVLDRVRSTYADQAAGRGLSLQVMRCSAIVETDSILLFRILANIVTNALRYTERGRVVVGCRRRASGVEIQVWDTGVGIPEDELGNIFKEFHQLGNAARDREQGLGLGLSIVERTARLLDHPLVVKSRVGHGSMFSIRVPLGRAESIRPAETAAGDSPASLRGCTVLVIEDEAEIRAAMTILLEGWGCTVMAAGSAREARALLEGSSLVPEIVIADYRLPGEENGIHAIRAVKARYPHVTGILNSGDIHPEILKEAEASGFKLLHKPLRPARLRALLGNVWRERAASREAAVAE